MNTVSFSFTFNLSEVVQNCKLLRYNCGSYRVTYAC